MTNDLAKDRALVALAYGADSFRRDEQIRAWRGADDAALGALNTQILDGGTVSLAEIEAAARALPFLGDTRTVIIHGLFPRLGGRRSPKAASDGNGDGGEEEEAAPADKKLLDGLKRLWETLPPSTRLLHSEGELAANHAALKALQALTKPAGKTAAPGSQVEIRAFALLNPGEVQGWLRDRTRQIGAKLHPEAAALLAERLGNDLRAQAIELDKLQTYTAGRPITRADVDALVSNRTEAIIFDLVEAISARQANRALPLLHQMLDQGAAPPYLLTMIVWQYRLLLEAKALEQKGYKAERQLPKETPFPVVKAFRQVGRYQPEQLVAIYRKLLAVDVASKTGRMKPEVALDLLVAELCR